MKKIILSTALILGAAAPVLAEGTKAPGFANDTTRQIAMQNMLSSDDGADRLAARHIADAPHGNSGSVLSSSNAVNATAARIFAGLTADADGGDVRLLSGAPVTVVSTSHVVSDNREGSNS